MLHFEKILQFYKVAHIIFHMEEVSLLLGYV